MITLGCFLLLFGAYCFIPNKVEENLPIITIFFLILFALDIFFTSKIKGAKL